MSRKREDCGKGRVVVCMPLTPQFAPITQLDPEGLTFIHRGRKLRPLEKINLDLFFTDGDTVVTDLSCKVVSEAPERIEGPFDSVPAWKCRVRFAGLKEGKEAELMSVIGRTPETSKTAQ